MGKRVIALLLVIAIVPAMIPTAAAQKDVDVFNWGVMYFVATGQLGHGAMSLGSGYDGKAQIPFDGCSNILARPSKGAAAVELVGVIDNANIIEVRFDEFRDPAQGLPLIDGVGANFTIDGSEDHEGRPTHPKVEARIATYAQAYLEIDGENYTEDGKTPKPFWASFFVTKNGFRDNETGAILTKSGTPYDPVKSQDPLTGTSDWEAHLRVEAPGIKKTTPINFRNKGDLPDGSISHQDEHRQEFRFTSLAPGGFANLTFRAESSSPAVNPTASWFNFRILAPNDKPLQNFTLSPGPLTPASKTVSVQLLQFGEYRIEVTGAATMAKYSITGFVRSPPKFDFNFWWDSVSFEKQALKEISTCKDDILNSLGNAQTSGIGRNKPPGISIETLAVGASVSVVSVLFLVKLVSDAVVTSQFKSVSKRRG